MQENYLVGGYWMELRTGSLLVEVAVLHPRPQQRDDLLLHQPVTLELGVGQLGTLVQRQCTPATRLTCAGGKFDAGVGPRAQRSYVSLHPPPILAFQCN